MGNYHLRLSELLVSPQETLDVEIKGWLDLEKNAEHKCIIAKAIIALTNHGGGHIIIGFDEQAGVYVEAPNRPDDLSAYGTDNINSIVKKYIEPALHCEVNIVDNDQAKPFPIISVTRGATTPVRSKKAAPNCSNSIKENVYYIRRPGPESAPPNNGLEWDKLIRRCIVSSKSELINLISNYSNVTEGKLQSNVLEDWHKESINRWRELCDSLPDGDESSFPDGYYCVSFSVEGFQKQEITEGFREMLRDSVVRASGWPPFRVSSGDGIGPWPYNDTMECWFGKDGRLRGTDHSDFWRVSSEGQFFLIRGFQEDASDWQFSDPGCSFIFTFPVIRIAEILLYISSVSKVFGCEGRNIDCLFQWVGLQGRELAKLPESAAYISPDRVAKQDVYNIRLSLSSEKIDLDIDECVYDIVAGLLRVFDLFDLPRITASNQLDKFLNR